MKPIKWGKGTTSKAGARPPAKAKRIARTIGWRVCAERSLASSAAREKHLRSLMGLPAKPTVFSDGTSIRDEP